MEAPGSLPVGTPLPPVNVNKPMPEANNDNVEREEEIPTKRTVKSMLLEFLDDTTTHGVPHAADDTWALGKNPLPRRIFWFVIWVCAVGTLVNFTKLRWEKFSSYPFNTVITLQSAQSLPFPAVTICPLNLISKAKASNYSSNTEVIYQDVINFGHIVDDFLVKCQFNLKKCAELQSWATVVDQEYGNCFSFNTSAIESEDKLVTEPNKDNGLTLRLAINAELYQTFSEELGFAVKVHDPVVQPDMADAIKIPSGFAAEVKIREEKVDRLPLPFHQDSPCRPNEGFESYNRARCERDCVNSHIISECQCGIGITPLVPKRCTTTLEVQCANAIVFPHDGVVRDSDGVACDVLCPMPCSETKYNMQLSLSDYPSKFDTRVLRKANVECMSEKKSQLISSFPEQCVAAAKPSNDLGPPPPDPYNTNGPPPDPYNTDADPYNTDVDPYDTNGPPPDPYNTNGPPPDPYNTNEPPPDPNNTNGPPPDPNNTGGGGTGPDPYTSSGNSGGPPTHYCAPNCPDYWIDDEYCDDVCNVPECNFDGEDCGGGPSSGWDEFGVDVGPDLGNLGDAARAELLALVGDGWQPSGLCQNISKVHVIEKYLDTHIRMSMPFDDLKDAGEVIMARDTLADMILSMTSTNSSTIGEWITADCGKPPSSNETVNWNYPPTESFVASAWANEKSEYALLRVYFSEFNVEHIEEAEAYGYISMLAEVGGTYGLAAGISVMTLFEFAEIIMVILYHVLTCGRGGQQNRRKTVYKVTPNGN